jgi:hypothetical protein
MVCSHFLMVHHLKNMEGLILEWMVKFIYFDKIEIVKTTYPFIFEGCDDNGVFICIKKFRV